MSKMSNPVYFDREPIDTEVHFRYNNIKYQKNEEGKTMNNSVSVPELVAWCIRHSADFPHVGEISLASARRHVAALDPDTAPAITAQQFRDEWNRMINDPAIMDPDAIPAPDTNADGADLYDVALSNRDCIFDSVAGVSFADAIAFARGRGGVYVVQMSRCGEYGCSYGYNSDTDTFRKQGPWGAWEPTTPEEIRSEL